MGTSAPASGNPLCLFLLSARISLRSAVRPPRGDRQAGGQSSHLWKGFILFRLQPPLGPLSAVFLRCFDGFDESNGNNGRGGEPRRKADAKRASNKDRVARGLSVRFMNHSEKPTWKRCRWRTCKGRGGGGKERNGIKEKQGYLTSFPFFFLFRCTPVFWTFRSGHFL